MIKAFNKSKEDVGNLIKNSKQKYEWNFEINNTPHQIELTVSIMSQKMRVFLDGKKLYEDREQNLLLNYNFIVDGVQGYLTTGSNEDFRYNLLLDGNTFDSLVEGNNARREMKTMTGKRSSHQIHDNWNKLLMGNQPYSQKNIQNNYGKQRFNSFGNQNHQMALNNQLFQNFQALLGGEGMMNGDDDLYFEKTHFYPIQSDKLTMNQIKDIYQSI